MPKGKMDDAAAERIAKARGNNDDFAKRAQAAAGKNKDQGGSSKDGGKDGKSSSGGKSK